MGLDFLKKHLKKMFVYRTRIFTFLLKHALNALIRFSFFFSQTKIGLVIYCFVFCFFINGYNLKCLNFYQIVSFFFIIYILFINCILYGLFKVDKSKRFLTKLLGEKFILRYLGPYTASNILKGVGRVLGGVFGAEVGTDVLISTVERMEASDNNTELHGPPGERSPEALEDCKELLDNTRSGHKGGVLSRLTGRLLESLEKKHETTTMGEIERERIRSNSQLGMIEALAKSESEIGIANASSEASSSKSSAVGDVTKSMFNQIGETIRAYSPFSKGNKPDEES